MKIAGLQTIFVSCSVVLLAACGGSAGHAEAPGAGKSPSPPEQARRLSALLLGDWKGTGSLTAEGKTTPIDVQLRCTETSSGWGVRCQATGADGNGVVHDETHLWGYSADGAKVHLFTVTSDGETHDHAGPFTDKGVTLQYSGAMGEKPFVESLRFESPAPSTLTFRNEATVGGAPAFTFDVTFRKS